MEEGPHCGRLRGRSGSLCDSRNMRQPSILYTVRRETGRGWCSSHFLTFTQPGTLAHEMVPPTFKVAHSALVKSIWKHPPRHACQEVCLLGGYKHHQIDQAE